MVTPGPDLRALAFVPPEDDGAGDVDAGIGAGDDADQESEGEIVDHAAAKNVERQVARNTVPEVMMVRLSVWLSAWLINSLKRAAHAQLQDLRGCGRR